MNQNFEIILLEKVWEFLNKKEKNNDYEKIRKIKNAHIRPGKR